VNNAADIVASRRLDKLRSNSRSLSLRATHTIVKPQRVRCVFRVCASLGQVWEVPLTPHRSCSLNAAEQHLQALQKKGRAAIGDRRDVRAPIFRSFFVRCTEQACALGGCMLP